MRSRAGIAIAVAIALAALSTAAVVATNGAEPRRQTTTTTDPDLAGRESVVPKAGHPRGGCPVTRDGWQPARDDEQGRLWIGFGPTGGVYRVPPDNIGPDGSLGVKIAWQRGPGVRGAVTVRARRLDGRAPVVRRRIPTDGYGPTGLLASGVAFPTAGCWKVTARAGGATLTFVLLLKASAQNVIVGCSRRSMASFPGGFTSPRNLVVGPLALQGAGVPTSASTVREFGGNKFPALVKAGHAVTVSIAEPARGFAGLAYGGLGRRPLPQGEVRLRDAAHTMTFIACPRRRRSGSEADGEPVTFWSGFVVADRPGCVPLEVHPDRGPRRRVVIDMGGRNCR
jgi:hypothetical protein